MSVDNQEIQDKLEELNDKLVINHKERKDLHNVIDELRAIIEVEDRNSDETPRAKKPIMDKGTGETINVARRQAIFDAQIIKANALLS